MFDPSKLNLDLDDNDKVSKNTSPEEIKVELKKVEQAFNNDNSANKENQDKPEEIKESDENILGDINKKFIEKDLKENEIKKEEVEKNIEEEEEEQKNIIGDISETIEANKIIKKEGEDKIEKNRIKENILIDINIKTLQNVLDIMLKNDYDIFVFEPRDNDIKIIFKNGKVEKDVKYIKFPIYNQILLKAKALTKIRIEETNIEQNGKGEIQIIDSKYSIISKTVPSPFGEKIFIKINKLEKKVEIKGKQNIELGKLFGFLGVIMIIILIIGGAFIGFIVANARTPEDVKFFVGLGINPNEINSFIGTIVTVVFASLVFTETIFLAMYSFKAMLTKKIYKSKKIGYSIFAIILLLLTMGTATAWITIAKKIVNLPDWQMLAKGDVEIYDNSKLLSGEFSKRESLLRSTTEMIGPVTLKFDLGSFEYRQRQKGFKVEKYIWSFGGKKEKEKKTSSIIKTFDKIGIYNVVVEIVGINSKGKKEIKTIENIKTIEISNIVKITEKNNKFKKTVKFDATDLKELGEIEWFIIEKDKKQRGKSRPPFIGYKFIPDKSIVEDTMFGISIKREGKKSNKIDKIFIIERYKQSTIKGEIKFVQNPIDDLKYDLYVENPNTAFGNGFVETFTWKLEDTIRKIDAIDFEDTQESSRISFKFKKHGKHNISVELKDSSGKVKILKAIINIPKRLKLKNSIKFKNDGEDFSEVKYESKNHEYFISDLSVPTKLSLDTKNIRTNNFFYKLENVSWDLDDNGIFDKITKTLDLSIDIEGNKTILVKYKFVHRKIKTDIVYITERLFIDSIKKDAILKLNIIPEKKYVPTFVKFDASLTQIKGKNIEKFIYDYGDGTELDERGSINPAHKYNNKGTYNIVLKVITTDGSSYTLNKKLVLNPKPEEAKIKASMHKTVINQEIDFSSENSQGQISGYFWDFGDGEVSTEANPSHMFEVAGKYTVKLEITFQNNNVLKDQVDIEITEF